jgi:phage tail protein X
MRTRTLTDSDRRVAPEGTCVAVYEAPPGLEDKVDPVEALVVEYEEWVEVSVPWEPDEIDVAKLANGGTVWLTVVGALFPHRIEVRLPDEGPD